MSHSAAPPSRAETIQKALNERYGGAVSVPEPANATFEHLLQHRSVRKYRPDPLPSGTVEALVAAAQSAASSSNLQLWSVIAVESAERRAALSKLAGNQAHIREAPLFLAWIADLSRLAAFAEATGVEAQGLHYLEMFLMANVDAALAAQNATIFAESLGLGTVYIGALRNRPLEIAELLNLPPRAFGVFGLVVGIPAENDTSAIKPRLPQPAVLHREQYNRDATEPNVAAYDATMAEFYAAQQLEIPGSWSRHSLRRVETPAALNGRDRLKEHLAQLGFPLQ